MGANSKLEPVGIEPQFIQGGCVSFVTGIKMKSNDQIQFQAKIKQSKLLVAVLSTIKDLDLWTSTDL